MWLFTKYGFFSVTRSRQEPDKLQIRAREKGDLQQLLEIRGTPGPDRPKILETVHSDYRFRIILEPQQAAHVMLDLIEAVDYPNFKAEIAANPKQRHKGKALHEIWHIMHAYQPRAKHGTSRPFLAPSGKTGQLKFGPTFGPEIDWLPADEKDLEDTIKGLEEPALPLSVCPACGKDHMDHSQPLPFPGAGEWTECETARGVRYLETRENGSEVWYRFAGPGRPKWYAVSREEFLATFDHTPKGSGPVLLGALTATFKP